MEYEDIRITITAKINGGNRVLIDSPAGDFAGKFVNTINKSSFDRMLRVNGLRVKSLEDARSKKGLKDIKNVRSTDNLDDIGRKLSKDLFQEEILNAYAHSQGMVNARRQGLRVRIRIDPGIKEYADLMNLPWEFLYDSTTDSPIELANNRAIIRDSITPKPVTSLNVDPPLKVLAVTSDPKDYPPLRLGREKDFLQKMSKKIPSIEVEFLRGTTIDAVDDEMSRQEYHIFHFMGHAGFNKKSKKCVLIFKGKRNKGIAVDGARLKTALADSVRLVFLNACETARIPEENPFAAIPTELLLRGIPAVLSMQFPISDCAAIRFCTYFYRHLAKGLPVDQCVGKGRQKIYLKEGISSEWGTPVLFMRSTDGVIFKIR